MTEARNNRLPRAVLAALLFAPGLFLVVFYAWPLATLTGRAFDAGTFADALSDGATWSIVWFTLWQAVLSTVLTVVVGIAPAYIVSRFRFPGRRLLVAVLTAVFVLPTVVVGAALIALLPDSLDHGVWAILGAHVVFNLAVVVRTVGAAWEQLPRDLEHAAATLGATPLQTFRHLSLPLLRPAVAASAAIVFLFTFTSFGVVRLLGTAGTRTIEVEVWRQATQLGDFGTAAVLSLLQLSVLALGVGWSAARQRKHSHSLALRIESSARPPRGTERLIVGGIAVTTALVVVVPLAALVERSVRLPTGYSLAAWRSLGDNEIRPGIRLGINPVDALWNSFTIALASTVLAVVLGGLAVAAISVTGSAGRFLDVGMMLPLGTSAVTIGFGILITFDTDPVDWRASWWIVPFGHALVAAPFVVRVALNVIRSVDPDLRSAAMTLGASPWTAWRTVTLPFLWRPLIPAAGLAAAISLGEFGATSFLSRSGGETVPIAIERLVGRAGSLLQAQGFALATILAFATIVIVLTLDGLGSAAGGGDAPR